MKRFLPLFLTILLWPQSAAIAGEQMAFGMKMGSGGVGLEVTSEGDYDVNMRYLLTWLQYKRKGVDSDVYYQGEVTPLHIGVNADYYPSEGGFRFTGGLFYNGTKLSANGYATNGTFDLGGTTYTAAQAGTLDVTVEWNKIAPYIGIGWGNPFRSFSPWTISFDFGLMYQGNAKATGFANGPLSADPTFRANLKNELKQLESSLQTLQWFPVLALTITYKF